MPKRTREYRASLLEDLQNPEEAARYLNAALEDSDEMFLVALRDVAEARQMAKVASEAGIAREALYKTLSRSGNPRYRTLRGVLNALGVRICLLPAGATSTDSPKSLLETTPQNAVGSYLPQGGQSVAREKDLSSEQVYASGAGAGGSNAVASVRLPWQLASV